MYRFQPALYACIPVPSCTAFVQMGWTGIKHLWVKWNVCLGWDGWTHLHRVILRDGLRLILISFRFWMTGVALPIFISYGCINIEAANCINDVIVWKYRISNTKLLILFIFIINHFVLSWLLEIIIYNLLYHSSSTLYRRWTRIVFVGQCSSNDVIIFGETRFINTFISITAD